MIPLYTFCSNCKQQLISEMIDSEIIITPCKNCSSADGYIALPTIEDFKAMLVCQYSLLKHCRIPDNEYGIMSNFMNRISQRFGYSTWVDARSSLLDWRKYNG